MVEPQEKRKPNPLRETVPVVVTRRITLPKHVYKIMGSPRAVEIDPYVDDAGHYLITLRGAAAPKEKT